jgi:nicotinamidase-related amidase
VEVSLELNAKETALVLIDLEHGIVGRDLAPYSGKDVVAKSAKLAGKMRSAGSPVVYVHVLLHETLSLPADFPMPRPAAPPPPEASELVPEAGYQPDTDVLITKRQWDAFYATNLDQLLRRKGVSTIVLAGIATNMGVESTARSAQARGYAVVFAEDAMSSMGDLHALAVGKVFPLIGRVRSTDEIVAALR